jgi:pyridoxine/pyridoxamine 5'-phosphate oxidase
MGDILKTLRDDHRDFINGTLETVPEGLNPFDFFCAWFEEAVQSGAVEANAMSVATLDKVSLQPSSRIVYLKEFFEQGLVFYTNYNSQKAHEIESNPKVALPVTPNPMRRPCIYRPPCGLAAPIATAATRRCAAMPNCCKA